MWSTVPVLRWCKEQGGVTGYPHSAMHVNPPAGAKRMIADLDGNGDGVLGKDEVENKSFPAEEHSVFMKDEVWADLLEALDSDG